VNDFLVFNVLISRKLINIAITINETKHVGNAAEGNDVKMDKDIMKYIQEELSYLQSVVIVHILNRTLQSKSTHTVSNRYL
jgi:flagellar basal body rod protein FlgB